MLQSSYIAYLIFIYFIEFTRKSFTTAHGGPITVNDYLHKRIVPIQLNNYIFKYKFTVAWKIY